MRFCNQHGLVKIGQSSQEYSNCFSALYKGPLLQEQEDE